MNLTKQETKVLTLLARGICQKQIAFDLGLSFHTIKNHRDHIYKKLGVHTLVGAVHIAITRNLVHPGDFIK